MEKRPKRFSCDRDREAETESAILHPDIYDRLERFYKSFGDPTRLKIMSLLLKTELCVRDIAKSLDMSQSAISHQIRTLKSANIVKGRRDGKMIYYSLDDDHVEKIFAYGIEHIAHRQK